MIRFFVFLALIGIGPTALAQTFAIENARIVTMGPDGTLSDATLIVEDGRISAVGEDLDVPRSIRTIDAEGAWVTPGIVSAFSRTGLVEVGAEDTTNDVSAGNSEISVALMASDGFNPAATPIAVTRADGVTRVVVGPNASGNIFAGQGFVADTSGRGDSMTQDQAFLLVTLGEGGAGRAGGSRPAAWAYFQAALSDARLVPPKYVPHSEGDVLNRLDAAALTPAATGSQLILIEANRASDLRRIIRLKQDEPALRLAILGATEGWIVADDLAEAGIPVIVHPFDNLPESFEDLGATQKNAERLYAAGVRVAFAYLDDDTHQAGLVLQAAGNAVTHGLPRDAALEAITRTPAEIFGLSDHGRLSEGAVADIVIWDGDPLEVTSAPLRLFISGQEQSLESRQTRLRDRYLDLNDSDQPKAYDRP